MCESQLQVSNYEKFKLDTHMIAHQLSEKQVSRQPITIKNFVIHVDMITSITDRVN